MAIKVTSNVEGVIAQIRGGTEKNLFAAAERVRTSLLKTLSGSRSGRIYPLPGGRGSYQASAPGEPPATRTGALRDSIHVQVQDMKAYVGPRVDYAVDLELGTSRVAPRPFMRPALEAVKADVVKDLTRRIE